MGAGTRLGCGSWYRLRCGGWYIALRSRSCNICTDVGYGMCDMYIMLLLLSYYIFYLVLL